MGEFLRALAGPDAPFLRCALAVGVLASLAFGVVGTYVVARRISYIAGAIAHSVLGGVGAGLYLRHEAGLAWLDPMWGALAAALLAALAIGLVSLHAREREDTVIGAIWAVGMAAGLAFLARTHGRASAAAMSYLFGEILLLSPRDLWLVAGLDLVVALLAALLYNRFQAVCFDEEFARLRGVRTGFYYLLLLCLVALTVVLLVPLVGVVLMIALVTLPAAVAGRLARRLWTMMLLASAFCALFTVLGLALSYGADLPSGPAIALVAGAAYLAVAAGSRLVRRRAA